MAVFDTARLRDVLVRGAITTEESAAEFVEELDGQLGDTLSVYPRQDRLDLMEERLPRQLAEMEARTVKLTLQTTGILLAGVALAVGIILGFG